MKAEGATELALILDWIANAQTYDAWEDVTEMVEEAPEKAWPLIRNMIDLAPTRNLLHAISAGPLEDLLSKHSEAFAQRMDEAASDAKFRDALEGVWLSEPEWMAERMTRARAQHPGTWNDSHEGHIAKNEAALIARWFHHSDTMWASTYLRDTVRENPDEAWRLLLMLLRVATEEHPDVVEEIDAHVFSLLVDLHGAAVFERIVEESANNSTMRNWVLRRASWAYLREEWRELLRRVSGSG